MCGCHARSSTASRTLATRSAGFLFLQPVQHGAAPVVDLAPSPNAGWSRACCVPAAQRILRHPELVGEFRSADPAAHQCAGHRFCRRCTDNFLHVASPELRPECGSLLVTTQAYVSGWQGGTGWHETRHPSATPCFIGISAVALAKAIHCAASQQFRTRRHSAANSSKSPDLQGVRVHSAAKWGWQPAKERATPCVCWRFAG